MASAMVLTEDEALELLAFLVTAARTQLDEAAEYGPLRLLTAAGRLAGLHGGAGLACHPRLPRRSAAGTAGRCPPFGRPDQVRHGAGGLSARAVGEHLVGYFGADGSTR